MLSALASALHLLGLALGFASLVARDRAMAPPFDDKQRDRLLVADNWAGIAALLWVGTGLWRWLGALEKPTSWYTHNPGFHLKLTLLFCALACEMWPMITFIRWRIRLAAGGSIETAHVPRLRLLNRIELGVVVCMVFVAAGMARGIGYHPKGEGFCGIERSFEAQCQSCHGSGVTMGGLNLTGDAYTALVDRKSHQWPKETRVVPGVPERSLLFRKLAGTQGKLGQRMPLSGHADPELVAQVRAWIEAGAPRCLKP